MRWRDTWSSISSGERKAIAAAAIAAILVTSISPFVAFLYAGARGASWTGAGVFTPHDTPVYLSYILQASRGGLLFQDLFTTEALVPRLDILWLAVGQLARVPLITPIAAFQFSRLILIPVFAIVAHIAVARLLRSADERLAALLIFLFASGIGTYAALLPQGIFAEDGPTSYPIDLWVADSTPFFSMMHSPHLIASFALFVLVPLLMLHAFDSRSLKAAAMAGFAGLVLFQFHPFHAPTLYAVPFMYLFARWTATRKVPRRGFAAYGLFVLVSVPSVLYHFLRLRGSASGLAFYAANSMPTAPWPFVLLGFGALLPLAALGLYAGHRGAMERKHATFLAIWIVVQTALMFVPFNFQRRLIEGLAFPIAVCAGLAVAALWRRARAVPGYKGIITRWVGAAALVALVLPSSIGAVVRNLEALDLADPSLYFLSRDETEAFEWMKGSMPRDGVVLASFGTGNLIPGHAGVRTYAGHPIETVDAERKNGEIDDFFLELSDDARRSFIEERGITNVFIGPRERGRYGDVDLAWMTPAYSSGTVTIYGIPE